MTNYSSLTFRVVAGMGLAAYGSEAHSWTIGKSVSAGILNKELGW